MSDEAAAALAQTLATAIGQQGDSMSAAISAAVASFGAMILGLLFVFGIVALALSVKGSADKNGNSSRDPILIVMAGLEIILYSWGMIDSSIAQNTILQASVVFMVGIYLVGKAVVFAIMKRG